MMRFDPFREIEELTQRMDRAFGGNVNNQLARLAPPVDVHEDEGGLELTLDLPGVQPDDIQIEAENQTLTVQAKRTYARGEGRTAHRVASHFAPDIDPDRSTSNTRSRGTRRSPAGAVAAPPAAGGRTSAST